MTHSPADYIADACRINQTTPDELFARPISTTREMVHLRWECLRLARNLAREDGVTYSHQDWSDATGLDQSTIGACTRRPRVRLDNMETVIQAVCHVCAVTRAQLGDKHRHPDVVVARMLATRAARIVTNLSYPAIARAIGRPNHSTVITANERYEHLTADGSHPHLTEALDKIIALCDVGLEVPA